MRPTIGQRPLWRRAHTDGSYASANDVRVHFGLGENPFLSGVAVVRPNDRSEIWRGIEADQFVTLREGGGEPWTQEHTKAVNQQD